MEKFKKAQVIMLPTNSSNIALLTSKTEFMIGTETSKSSLQGGKEWVYNKSITDNSTMPQHLYIISDDKIKEGDYMHTHKGIERAVYDGYSFNKVNEWCKKIIATTDRNLIIRGKTNNAELLPQPSQQFTEKYIESYNKGLILSDVLVEYEQIPRVSIFSEYEPGIQTSYGYKLKVNPKDNTIIIKPLRESWSREEVEELCKNAWQIGFNVGSNDETSPSYLSSDDWVKQNL